MKLYVWVDPYPVSYGSSMVFAIADNEESARIEAAKGKAYAYGQYDDNTPNVVLGKPDRVLNLPCAEWHRWEE